MKLFSLRRRVMTALVMVFLLGVVATSTFYHLELRHEVHSIHQEFDNLSPKSADELESLLTRMRGEDVEFLGLVFAPVFLIGASVIWLVLRWGLRGLPRLSKEVAALEAEQPGQYLSCDGLPMELHPLVDAVNGSIQRAGLAYDAERRLTANCAHELRTPLTVLRLRLESGRTQRLDWAAVERDLAQLERLVAQLLDLARKESASGKSQRKTSVNLTRVLRETSATLHPLVQRAGRQIEVQAEGGVHVFGRSSDLADMIRNLLDNTLTHGRGNILARLETDGRVARLRVSDDGPGIPQDQSGRVFERFVKLDSNSHGAGLGLCIVREVVLDHAGDCGVLPEDGAVWVSLPISNRLTKESLL